MTFKEQYILGEGRPACGTLLPTGWSCHSAPHKRTASMVHPVGKRVAYGREKKKARHIKQTLAGQKGARFTPLPRSGLVQQPVEKVKLKVRELELDQYERQRKRSAAVARSRRSSDRTPQNVFCKDLTHFPTVTEGLSGLESRFLAITILKT